MAKVIFSAILFIHGSIHLLGFVKAFNLAQIAQLTEKISRAEGLYWLLAALLFIATAVLYLLKINSWWMAGAAALVVSETLIILSWSSARYGTVANLILLLPIIIAWAGELPTSYQNRFKAEVEKGVGRYSPREILKKEDLVHLPQPVQKYIRYSGAVGKEKLHNFRAVLRGQFKTEPDSEFLDIRAVQYNFFDDPARAFYMESYMHGVPVNGLHLYVGPNATMQITIANLLQVVDARGAEMDRSETVTMLNDICFFAPAALIDQNIMWEAIDSTSARATFTNRGQTITATLFFNEKGELVNFSSDDRAESVDGKVYKNYPWTTPLSNYKEFDGRKLASYGEAIWHKPDGAYTYAKFTVVDIEYNCDTFIDE